MDSSTQHRRTYGLLVQEANARGIGRTVAFQLAARGLLDVFKIGRRRFVFLDSLDTLPQRLAERERGQAA